MHLEITNCNNIESGIISINRNKLNIKYAINGTGKTTIAKAIKLYVQNDNRSVADRLSELKPFKYREINDEAYNPQINGLETVSTVAIFNEEYVDQYVFLKDELVKNSFDIFIRDENYEKGIEEINSFVRGVKEKFENDEELNEFINNLNELSACFGTSKKISKSSILSKGLSSGNNVVNIPKVLEPYKEFIQHENNAKWIKWQTEGNDFLDLSSVCPYCTSMEVEDKKDTILAVKDKYNPNLIKHLNKVISVFESLSEYFPEGTYQRIKKIAQNVDGLRPEHEEFLNILRKQIDLLIDKLNKIKYMSFSAFKDLKLVRDFVEECKIDFDYFQFLYSEKTTKRVNAINEKLEEIIIEAGRLQGAVNKQKKYVEKTIKENKTEINEFLRYAGYNYQVDLIEENVEPQSNYKLVLSHKETRDNIENPKSHLSYGEKNAFALVLFMYDVIKKNPDLVILDDPISSFDRNKKFAIINMLFKRKRSLKDKTVLMLTHDFDPIVDMVHHMRHIFSVPSASFIENRDGKLLEKEINREDIKTFAEIIRENMAKTKQGIIKAICLRRLLEFQDEKGAAYELLSNIAHKREIPIYKSKEGAENKMSQEDIFEATNIIKKYGIEDFNYDEYYNTIKENEILISMYHNAHSNYEKLQLYRLISPGNNENEIIRKFVNETYHIENDYLYQLNPYKYQLVPNYIINECDKDIRTLKEDSSEVVSS